MKTPATVIICARDASATIERAVRSVLETSDAPLLLIDDGSTDSTVERARDLAGHRLSVVQPPEHHGIGYARNFGIRHVQTPVLIWLDADDALLPGHVETMTAALLGDSLKPDIAFNEVDLHDGATGRFRAHLPIPGFLKHPGAMTRLFERCYLPGPAWHAVRTETACRLGYSSDFPTGDDYDFLLRAVRAGCRFTLLDSTGYQQFEYPDSVSRNLKRQRTLTTRALQKHDYGDIFELVSAAGYDEPVAHWTLINMAMFRNDWASATGFLKELAALSLAPETVLEPDGPLPVAEGWRQAFYAGTFALYGGDAALAAAHLKLAEAFDPTPEGANNFGVALAQVGQAERADDYFERAEDRFPGYRDATLNCEALRQGETPEHITTHPLRRQPSRSSYLSPAEPVAE